MVRKPDDLLPRFLAPDLDPAAPDVSLPAEEARHATRVLRLGPGAPIAVFDGRGNEFLARITEVRRDTVRGTLVNRVEPAAEAAVPFTLAQAVLKGSAMDDVVRDATMMGVTAIHPLIAVHGAVKPAHATRSDVVERWQRIAIASAKQSRRATVPVVAAPSPLGQWLAGHDFEQKLMFVEPSAHADTRSLREFVGRERPRSAALLVGPEGGWAASEVTSALARGCIPVTLGGLTLRADAVPIAAISVCRFLWE